MGINLKFVISNAVILAISIVILYWLAPGLINDTYLQYNEAKTYHQLQAENKGIAFYKSQNIKLLTHESAMSYDYAHGTQLDFKLQLPAASPATVQAQLDKLSSANTAQITELERELARQWWCDLFKIIGTWIGLTFFAWVINNLLDCCFKKKISQFLQNQK